MLSENEQLLLTGIRRNLRVLRAEGFERAADLRQKVVVLSKLPGGGGMLADIFTVLTDAQKAKREYAEQHLEILVETLNEAIVNPDALRQYGGSS